MTALDRDEIIAMRKDGRSWQQIADHYGITRERVRQAIRNMDLGPARDPLKPPVDFDRLAEMFHAGYSDEGIAAEFGVKPATIGKYRVQRGLYRTGPAVNHRGVHPPETWAKVEAMLDEGMSYKAIQAATGIHGKTIAQHFPGRGWTPKQAGDYRALERWGMKKVDQVWGGVA